MKNLAFELLQDEFLQGTLFGSGGLIRPATRRSILVSEPILQRSIQGK